VVLPLDLHLQLDVPVDRREKVSAGISFFRPAAAAAALAPRTISVSTVRVSDPAAHAADRETGIGVTSLNTALTREGLNGEPLVTEAICRPLRPGPACWAVIPESRGS